MALRQILRQGTREDVLQKLAKYNVQIQELAGRDLQIGDRVYNGWTEQAVGALVQAICSQIAELLQVQSPKIDLKADQEIIDLGEMPSCPYQGLSAFQEKHAAFFFGRDRVIERLVQDVQAKPLVAVIGSSGSGKSSLVFAGLVPRLWGTGDWLIESFRPKNQPFDALASALVNQLEPTLGKTDQLLQAAKLGKALQSGELSLQQVVSQIEAPRSPKLLLIADQFEELYTLCPESDRIPFLDVLLAGVKDIAEFKLVLTLRADFCEQAYKYEPFTNALQDADLKLSAMNRESLQLAIECPATLKQVELEAGLAERILNEVGQEPGNLPLLEFALTQLWAKQQRRKLTHQAYTEIGGVTKALANHAEAIYSQLNEGEQKQAQRIFLQLVQPRKGIEATRRVATRAEVGNWSLVTFLASETARLIVTGRNEQDEETVEVVHEALIRQWQRLRHWINEDEKKLKQKADIEAAADKWVMEKKQSDYLLRGLPLANAQAFRKEQAGKLTLQDFLAVLKRQRSLKDLKMLRMERSGRLALSAQAEAFIRRSLEYKRTSNWSGRFRTIGLLIVPTVAIFMVVEPYLRKDELQKNQLRLDQAKRNRNQALNIIRSRSGEWRKALDDLELECGVIKQLAKSARGCKNLSNMNLSNINFSNFVFSNFVFIKTNLVSTNLSNTNLIGAVFVEADLRNTSFNRANLTYANFNSANLSGIDLSSATKVDLTYASFVGADLRGASFSGANLLGTSFMNANLRNANLRNANLNANLTAESDPNAIPSSRGITFSQGASALPGDPLQGGNLVPGDAVYDPKTNLTKADISGANLRGAQNLKPELVKTAQNWDKAIYDEAFCKELGLKECRTR